MDTTLAPTAPTTALEDRAATLLGSGLPPATVAASLGCSESYLSQLLSTDTFAARVAALRYETLAKHNERDSSYDSLEDDLLIRLRDCLPLMHKPMEILKAIQVINAAKRRGASSPEAILEKQNIVSLVMPVQIIHKFTANIQNQVIQAGSQELLTIQSGTLAAKIKEKQNDLLANGTERTGTNG